MSDAAIDNVELIIHSSNLVFTKSADSNGNEVWMESSKNPTPSLDELIALKNDYEISRHLQHEGILKSRELVKKPNSLVVVKDFFNGQTLSEFIQYQKPSVQQVLEISIKLTKIIRYLHENKIIHKDIHPDNILITPNGAKLCIANFGASTQLVQEKQELRINDYLKGTLTHISPEQTGRMNRSIDYRSDFYSLGVLLYQTLCNRLPFEFDDSLEIIHAHIARYPTPPHLVNSAIPKVLSNIVMKLLSKNAEERYQSETGLLWDLEECLKQWKKSQTISNFKIATKDFSPVLTISEKLYGRKEEIEKLVNTFNRIQNNPPELILIGGYSGIGKTRLINEIDKPVAAGNGYFCSGKFDQFNRDKPFSAFREALGSLIKQILKGNRESIKQWKNKLLNTLDNNGQVLVEVFPELELLIGKQEAVLKLGLQETNNRFLNLFQKLLMALSGNNQPIAIFLDDLHWADSGSFDLIHKTITNKELRNVLIIGAYRNNETSVSHPLMLMVDSINHEIPDKIQQLILNDLNRDEVNLFIADSLRLDSDEVIGLTGLIMKKTRGNPYFIIQFLKKLADENLIQFDFSKNRWNWDIEAISGMNVTEYVVDLLVTKINKLPEQEKKILKLASCIGSSFDIKSLLLITEHNESKIFDLLWNLVNDGLIVPKNKWSRHAKDEFFLSFFTEEENELYDFFKFLHDRIHQASYSMIPDEEKNRIHYKLGMFLLEKYKANPQNELLFELLNHLNYSTDLIDDDNIRVLIAELNLNAGEKAKQSNAYQPALIYLEAGMDLLKDIQSSDLSNKLLLARSETEYLCGHYQESEKLFDLALENSSSNIEKSLILAAKMSLYENTNRQLEAIKIALEGLSMVGFELPEKPGKVAVLTELVKAKYYLRNKSFDKLKNNREMDSQELLIAMKILTNLWGPAYLYNQNLLALSILKMVILSTRYGICSESALAYAFYGFVLSAQLKDYKNGLEYARLGMWINEKFDDKTLRSKVYVIYAGCVAYWTVKRSELLPILSQAHKVGIESNDLIYASYAFSFIGQLNLYIGTNLQENRNQIDKYIQFTEQIQYPLNIHYMKTLGRLHYDLTGETPNASVFLESVNKSEHLNQMEKIAAKDGTYFFIATHHIYQGIVNYHLNEFQTALEHFNSGKKHSETVLGLEQHITSHLYHSLTLIALALNGQSLKLTHKLKIISTLSHFKKLSRICPENFKAQYLILKAEWLHLNKKYHEAELTYASAREVAKETELTHILGIANERSARYYFKLNMTDIANRFIQDAYSSYFDWGASKKLKWIKKDFPGIRFVDQGIDQKIIKTESGKYISSSNNIDLQSVLNASTTISGEIVFEKLLEKLLKIIIENAGAQKIYLLMVKDKELVAEAFADSNQSVQFLKSLPVDEITNMAKSMVQQVYHTGESIITNDADKDPRFACDPHILSQITKSVMVLPIKQHGKILAILYMENNIASGAFTRERIELLNLLSGQMAVSLENSSLYKNLEQKVIERTKIIEDQKKEIEEEKEKAEKLLLNILPTETADELKQTGSYKPRKYESVSIIFTDFEGFTRISENLTTDELVEMIDTCYKEFDIITTKYNIEKIKTIGDSYMCVSGLPIENKNHAVSAVNAAFEMHAFINKFNAERKSKGLPYCLLRIGVHSGPVVAGVVGSKKFAYDIWGDSVNIASRLESAADAGTINISNDTYNLIKNNFDCIHRGKIAIKNKEDIDMYFVNETLNPKK